jgi:hypothetical protein
MSYIGRGLETGSMRQLDDISSSFDGSTTAFTMQINSVNVDQSVVGDVNQLVLSLGGVVQNPGTDFTVSGSTLTFTTAPASGLSFFSIVIGGGGGFATPGDLTVTAGKLATDIAITTTGAANFNGGITMGGTTPSLTIGDAGAEDTKIVFDGNAQDFHIGLDDSTDSLTIGLGSALGTTSHMVMDATGAVTKPLQPAVLAVPNATQNDMATGWVTIVFGSEVYDVNSDFNTSTSTFTAPVTGKYMVTANVDLSDIDTATQWMYGGVFVTSNRTYYMNLVDPTKEYSADNNSSFSSAGIVDMDASDTLLFKVRTSAHGAAQMNVMYGSGETWLSICLIA